MKCLLFVAGCGSRRTGSIFDLDDGPGEAHHGLWADPESDSDTSDRRCRLGQRFTRPKHHGGQIFAVDDWKVGTALTYHNDY
ncbi:hypothetical protein EGR_09839 [Echinococcus granulosus]|uniref:Uncharacterized protein n=1 Tax=Echinococcus granulosus TaxID=6210 RepID=W6UA10_ECHGR|nr:hypothetical protein EGR_09839 [Echinococcus granulosus]EUB55312.1 hypothetical protein EGR_09839 [Echinococcus granulosus]